MSSPTPALRVGCAPSPRSWRGAGPVPLCGWLSSTIARGLSEEQQGNRRPRRPQEVLSGCVRKQRGGWKVWRVEGALPDPGQCAGWALGAVAGGSSHWNVAGLLYLSLPTDNLIFSKQRPCTLIPHGHPLGSGTTGPQICVLILCSTAWVYGVKC